MTTIAARTPEIVSTPEQRTNEWEISVGYERSGNASATTTETMHVDLTVMRSDRGHPAELLIGFMTEAQYAPSPATAEEIAAGFVIDEDFQKLYMEDAFSPYVTFSIAEARILRDLLNRSDVQALLDAGDQH